MNRGDLLNKRDLLLLGAAVGAVAGGVGWLVTRALTAPRGVIPVELGEPLPSFSGKLLSGRARALPGDLHGDLGLLILTWDYAALDEVMQWTRETMERYGLLPGIQVYQVAMVSGVGPILRQAIDRAMQGRAPVPEREHTLVVYGDLRALRRQLDTAMTARPHPTVLLIDRQGRIVWRADGPPTLMHLVSLRKALAENGIESRSEA
jgi:hypothetical protein